tara:strand:- start:2396 stop:2623 length:228 start_codon:yes stop_codon:yes gene_type:complete
MAKTISKSLLELNEKNRIIMLSIFLMALLLTLYVQEVIGLGIDWLFIGAVYIFSVYLALKFNGNQENNKRLSKKS